MDIKLYLNFVDLFIRRSKINKAKNGIAINILTDKYLKKKYGWDANTKYTIEIIKTAIDQNFITDISKNFFTNTF